MKNILFLLLLIPFTGITQDSTITNLQLKYSTVKLLIKFAAQSSDTNMIKTFLAWNVQVKANTPNDNSNVTISSARTVNVAKMYEYILSLPNGFNQAVEFTNDFKTSIQSKRNGNTLLDDLCTALETAFLTGINNLLTEGDQLGKLQ